MINLNNDVKIFAGVIIATIALILAAVFLMGKQASSGRSNQSVNPTAQTVSSEILVRDSSWSEGSISAKVTIVEFGDFQCPSCKSFEPTMKAVRTKYKDKIRFVFRHFPLIQTHEYAMSAALAAQAAGNQGKFWEMYDKLYENQPILKDGKLTDSFEKSKLVSFALQLGLNEEKFLKDFDSDSNRQQILDDMSDGNKANVQGTPTIFINGKNYNLQEISTLTEFSSKIDPLLK